MRKNNIIICDIFIIDRRDVNAREVENEELLEQLVEEGNRKLKAVNRHYYVVIVPITYVSEDEFE